MPLTSLVVKGVTGLAARGAYAFLRKKTAAKIGGAGTGGPGVAERLDRLRDSLVAVAHDLSLAAANRTELAKIELREQLTYLAETAVWGAVCLVAAGGTVLMGALAIIFSHWNTHRVLASVLVTSGVFVIAAFAGVMAYLRLRALTHSPPHSLPHGMQKLNSRGSASPSKSLPPSE